MSRACLASLGALVLWALSARACSQWMGMWAQGAESEPMQAMQVQARTRLSTAPLHLCPFPLSDVLARMQIVQMCSDPWMQCPPGDRYQGVAEDRIGA